MEKIGQSLSQELEAAQAVSLPTDAFGKLCAFLPPLFVDAVEIDAIESAQTALGEDGGEAVGGVTAAKAASDAVRMAGGIVAAVRMVVRDLVARAVGRLAAWAAEEVFSFSVATPLVAAWFAAEGDRGHLD
ncbi:hypothetical protein [Nocardia sp. CA-120079]|uniref:hypothetical protein n=1 Tax=Nocardia sp. CA-120079 TaxID=3239974 RepID=UPI003D986104